MNQGRFAKFKKNATAVKKINPAINFLAYCLYNSHTFELSMSFLFELVLFTWALGIFQAIILKKKSCN